jgi:hypothetical protein
MTRNLQRFVRHVTMQLYQRVCLKQDITIVVLINRLSRNSLQQTMPRPEHLPEKKKLMCDLKWSTSKNFLSDDEVASELRELLRDINAGGDHAPFASFVEPHKSSKQRGKRRREPETCSGHSREKGMS